jgi:hypothetical protein
LWPFAAAWWSENSIIDIDEADRRLVWSAMGGRTTHYNASAQVFAVEARLTKVAWIADFCPTRSLPTGSPSRARPARLTDGLPRPRPAGRPGVYSFSAGCKQE